MPVSVPVRRMYVYLYISSPFGIPYAYSRKFRIKFKQFLNLILWKTHYKCYKIIHIFWKYFFSRIVWITFINHECQYGETIPVFMETPHAGAQTETWQRNGCGDYFTGFTEPRCRSGFLQCENTHRGYRMGWKCRDTSPSLIGHIARYAPSPQEETCSKPTSPNSLLFLNKL